jgi:hypothetical protein
MKTLFACHRWFTMLVLMGVFVSLVGLPAQSGRAAPLSATIPVTTTIQAAIDLAAENDTVSIPAGDYTESLTISKSLTLAGPVSGVATITAPSNQRVIKVTANNKALTLIRLTLTGGNPTAAGDDTGGAVMINNGYLVINRCRIHANHGTYGGAIFQGGSGSVMVSDSSTIYNNSADVDGGGIYANGVLGLVDTALNTNTAGGHGGGAAAGNLTTLHGQVNGNQAGQNGGGANVSNTVEIDGTHFAHNIAGHDGGGLLQWNATDGVSVTIQNALFDYNLAANVAEDNASLTYTGGAVSIYHGAPTTISNTKFVLNSVDTNNHAKASGGAVFFDASAGANNRAITITTSTFQENKAVCTGNTCGSTTGGGLSAQVYSNGSGTVTLNDDQFIENNAWMGGGIQARHAKILRGVFTGNTAGYGAGVALVDSDSIQQSWFTDNVAVNQGAAIMSNGLNFPFTLTDTRLIHNQGGHSGDPIRGVILDVHANEVTMANVAVAQSHIMSGAVVAIETLAGVHPVSLNHITLNGVTTGGTGVIGIKIKGTQSAVIKNSIVANFKNPTQPPPEARTGIYADAGAVCSVDHSLFYNNDSNTAGSGTITITNPVSGAPAFAADDYHLTKTSAAINHGVVTTLTTDIDDDVRDSQPDLGVDEYRLYVFIPDVMK